MESGGIACTAAATVRKQLAEVLNLVAEAGTWPVPLTRGLMLLIPKGEGSVPQKLTPTGLMASVYRLWASLRVRDIIRWQENRLTPRCMVTGAEHVLRACGWVSRCPWNPLWLMALICWVCRSTGANVLTKFRKELPSGWLRGKANILACCKHRELRIIFVMAGQGQESAASNGIIQGCPLSVLLLNVLMNTWARSVKAGTTAGMPKVDADDAGVLSKDSEDIDIKIHGMFCQSRTAKTERR